MSQGIAAAPHGVMPPHFPIFSKPITNLRGMGTGSQIIRSAAQYKTALTPGHFWMELLRGAHVSTDVAVLHGRAVWWRHATGIPRPGGTLDRWIIHAEPRPALEAYCAAWIDANMPGYSGMMNFETIGGRIIEAHLRFADQWPDLYGAGWVAALIGLYAGQGWNHADTNPQTGYSVILFAPHGRRYRPPSAALQADIRARPGISSLQITFHPGRANRLHAMPPGGFRLAIVNCRSLAAGRMARRDLAAAML